MKTIRQVSAPGGQVKACADAPAGEVGTKRKASGVDHHPAKHSHGKFKSSENKDINVNHHPAGPSLVTKNEENPQLPSENVTKMEENLVLPSCSKKPFDNHAPGILESEWPPDLLAAIDAAWDFVACNDPFAIHAPGPELFAAMDAAKKDKTNKLSGPERVAAIVVAEKDLPFKHPVEWL